SGLHIGNGGQNVRRPHRLQACVPRRALTIAHENLLGEASEAAKMTIHSAHFANDFEAAHPWIILPLPSLRRAESATPSRRTRQSSIGCRKSRGSPNRKTFSGATARRKRTRG